LGRYGDAVPLARRLAGLRPNDHRTLNIAFSAMRRALRYAEASALAGRLREIHRLEQRYWISDAWIFDAAVAWASKNQTATRAELNRATTDAFSAGDAAQASVLPEIASLYLAIGQPDDARRVLASVSDVPRRQLYLAIVALHEGRQAEARAMMQNGRFGASDGRDLWDRVWVLARAGALDEARRLTTLARQPVASGSMMVEASRARNEWLDAAEAEIALAMGDVAAAVPLLQRALPVLMADVTVTPSQMYRSAEALADALVVLGRDEEARQTLEAVLDRRERETFAGASYWAQRCAIRLAALRRGAAGSG
jgi:tetratricopeptide (TPR) repeat protein